MKLNDRVYDILKWFVLVVIPALTVFYSVIDEVFQIGYSDIVCKLSAGLCACLGAVLGISTAEYNKDNYNG